MTNKPTFVDITVRCDSGAYITSTVRGQRASCTHSAEEAANRLGRKLFGFKSAQLVPSQADHSISIWRLHGVEGSRNVNR